MEADKGHRRILESSAWDRPLMFRGRRRGEGHSSREEIKGEKRGRRKNERRRGRRPIDLVQAFRGLPHSCKSPLETN